MFDFSHAAVEKFKASVNIAGGGKEKRSYVDQPTDDNFQEHSRLLDNTRKSDWWPGKKNQYQIKMFQWKVREDNGKEAEAAFSQ